jgi:hypothetical protein
VVAGFNSLTELGRARDTGRVHTAHFRKVPSQASVAGNWADISMAAGNPKPNYYASAPLVAAKLDKFDGLFHGDNKAPYSKHLTQFGLMTPSASFVGQFRLMDYLLYYPFVDGDAAGEDQAMDNTVTLDRYTDGNGVHAMAVAVAPTTGGGSFTYSYIDQNGNPQTSPTISVNTTAANIATLLTSEQGTVAGGLPFLRMADGSSGIRSITNVNVIAPMGGLFALVLVKPLADAAIRELNTPAEVELVSRRPGAPRVEDGAYLNFIVNPAGSLAAAIVAGWAQFAWSE